MRRFPLGLDSAGSRPRRKSASRLRIEALEDRRLLATLFVTNVDDGGPGSLRQAILDANSGSGSDIINFNINGPGVHTIALSTTALPTIVDTVLVDGTSQPANGGPTITTPLIQITGTGLTGSTNNGFTINTPVGTSPSTIRGIAIGGFSGSGVAISGVGGNAVQQSLIGTNADGSAALANGTGVTITDSANNSIGGTQTAFRNIISGNTGNGILITGSSSSSNSIQGNMIGLDVGGTTAIANGSGIQIVGAANNTVGGAIAAARNVISGNTNFGLRITATGATNNAVQGNFIGLNSSGNGAVANDIGLQIDTAAASNSVGGTAVANRNVMAGNITANLQIIASSNNLVTGNTVGLNVDGTAAVNLTQATKGGVVLEDGATGNTIGGLTGTSSNVISGAAGPNVLVRGRSDASVSAVAANNLFQGNFVGTNLAGTTAVATASGGGGITLSNGTTGNTIGGSSSGLARNVIAGNFGNGITLRDAATTGNVILGNNIGVQSDGKTAIPNTGAGVFADGAVNNTVGGTTSGAGNVIASNGGQGVFVNTASTGIAIQQNSIFSNTMLGIDLAPIGVNENIAVNPGVGANNLQNYPVLTSVTTANGVTTVSGTLHSAPSTSYTIELYSNTTSDPSNHGQGQTRVGVLTVTTDASGNATFSSQTTSSVPLAAVISSTATDGKGNTSEFSLNVVNAAPSVDLVVTKTGAPEPVAGGGLLTYTITVRNNGPANATNVVMTDTLPTGVSFIGATSTSGTIAQSGSTVTATIGTLANGGTATITISVVSPTTPGSITDTATATASESDPNSGNNTATFVSTVVAGPDLGVVAAVNPATIGVGQTSTISFVVTNNSLTVTANDVTLTAPLSANFTVVSSSVTQGSTSTTGGTLTAAIGTLGVGQSATVNLVVSPTVTGTIATTATVISNAPDVNPLTNQATATLTVSTTPPPSGQDGPRVLGLDRAGLHVQPARLTLTFDSELLADTATNLANYSLVTAGRDGRFNTGDDRAIPFATAFYNAASKTVTLRTRRPYSLHQRVQFTAVGTAPNGIKGSSGLLLDGADTGQPGSDFVTVFRGVGPGRISITSVDSAIDSLVAASSVKRKKKK